MTFSAHRVSITAVLVSVGLTAVAAGCGGDSGSETATSTAQPAPAAAAAPGGSGLTPEELEKGIGPIKTVALGPIDEELEEQGEEVFKLKCAACHKMDIRYVGPALGDVLARRQPEYVMNMMLNPMEMVEKHPEAKKLLGEFFTPMPNQGLTEAEARAVLEYLRSEQNDADDDADADDGDDD
jgi:mono/diheme cytochrome c family protein